MAVVVLVAAAAAAGLPSAHVCPFAAEAGAPRIVVAPDAVPLVRMALHVLPEVCCLTTAW